MYVLKRFVWHINARGNKFKKKNRTISGINAFVSTGTTTEKAVMFILGIPCAKREIKTAQTRYNENGIMVMRDAFVRVYFFLLFCGRCN